MRRGPPRRSADPAADVEDALAGEGFEERYHLLCRLQPPAVEVVEWGERVGRNRARLAASCRPKRSEDAGCDALAGVVVLDLVTGCGHVFVLLPSRPRSMA